MNKNKKKTVTEGLKYKGTVTIEFKRNNKVYRKVTGHNAGGKSLYKFIALALTGNYYNNLRPKFIRLFYDNALVSSSTIPHNKVRIQEESDGCSAVYSFLIPYGATTGTKFNKVRLYCADNYNAIDEYSAEYEVSESEEIKKDTNIQITWKLKITGDNN